MEIFDRAPAFWDDKVRSAALLAGFTEAHRELGYEVYYLSTAEGCATLHVKGGGRTGILFKRTHVFCDGYTNEFLRRLMDAAKALKIPLLRLGNTIYGLARAPELSKQVVAMRERHTFVTDLTADMDTVVQAFPPPKRRDVKKAQRSGITVHLAESAEDIQVYAELSEATTDRIRKEKYYRSYPVRFFTTLFETLIPKGQAVCLLAKKDGVPLAGGFFTVKDRVAVYYHGCSTRKEGEKSWRAPSLLLFAALEQAKERGCTVFDWGGCSPNVSPDDSRYGIYQFKKGWGGELVTFYNGDVWVNPFAAWMQERILVPVYERLRSHAPSFAERVYR